MALSMPTDLASKSTIPASARLAFASYLSERAVPLAIAESIGIRIIDSAAAAQVMGFSLPQAYWLYIPYVDEDGRVVQHRVRRLGSAPTHDKARFLSPAGVAVEPYFPPPPLVEAEVWRDPRQTVAICEGPVKAVAMCAAGFPAIGLAGALAGGHDVEAWKAGNAKLHSVLQRRLVVRGRKVILVFDDDRTEYASVALGEALLGRAFLSAGADVRCAAINDTDGQSHGA
jgi:hypothetical protein